MKTCLFAALFAVVVVLGVSRETEAQALAFPGCEGYACTSRHAFSLMPGTQPTICYITSLSNSGNGTLRAFLEGTNDCATSGPRIGICEVSGYVTLSTAIEINDPYLLINMSACPSPGLSIRGDYFYITAFGAADAHDILVKHVRIRIGDLAHGGSTENSSRQCFGVEGAGYNVIYDHNSCAWHTDDGMMVFNVSTHDVTFSNNLIGEGLFVDSTYSGSCGALGTGSSSSTFIANILVFKNLCANNAKSEARNGPTIGQQMEVAVVNTLNYNYNSGAGSGILGYQGGFPDGSSYLAFVGNVWKDGPNMTPGPGIYWYGTECTPSCLPMASGELYKTDNIVIGSGMSEYHFGGGFDPLVGSAPSRLDGVLDGLTILSSADVLTYLTTYAGARATDRDSLDTRIAGNVVNGDGALFNTGNWGIGGAFTYPTLANNCIDHNTANHATACADGAHQMPASPFSDDDSDGYYNVEEWLASWDCEVEGGVNCWAADAPHVPTMRPRVRKVQ